MKPSNTVEALPKPGLAGHEQECPYLQCLFLIPSGHSISRNFRISYLVIGTITIIYIYILYIYIYIICIYIYIYISAAAHPYGQVTHVVCFVVIFCYSDSDSAGLVQNLGFFFGGSSVGSAAASGCCCCCCCSLPRLLLLRAKARSTISRRSRI